MSHQTQRSLGSRPESPWLGKVPRRLEGLGLEGIGRAGHGKVWRGEGPFGAD
jgi:hypothetical protein